MHPELLELETPATRSEQTHLGYILSVRELAVGRAVDRDMLSASEARRLLEAKVVYGVGAAYRGVCIYGAWKPADGTDNALIEISALNQEHPLQLAGTTIHETAHVLAGHAAGHGPDWKGACKRLGLNMPNAAPVYTPELFDPWLLAVVQALPEPDEGTPQRPLGLPGSPVLPKGLAGGKTPGRCAAGYGTRGGTSRGVGSGSRARLWACSCNPAPKVRAAAGSGFDATCNKCSSAFKLVAEGEA